MKRKLIGISLTILALIMLGLGSMWYYMQTKAFMETAGQELTKAASDALGVQISVSDVELKSINAIELHNVAVYDKQAECLLRADTALINYRLLAALTAPAEAVKEVVVENAAANIIKRTDGSWNYEDLMSDSASNQAFHSRIKVKNSTVNVSKDGKVISFSDVNGKVDFADYPLAKFEVTAGNAGAQFEAAGTVRAERQIVNIKAGNVDLTNYMTWLPEGIMPENTNFTNGVIKAASLHVLRDGSKLSYSGDADFVDGKVTVEQTVVDNIAGHINFTDAEALLNVSAEANQQKVNVHGKISLADGSPYLNLTVTATDFDIAKVLTNIPYQGAVNFSANITGSISDPLIDGNIKIAAGKLQGISFSNVSANLRYQNEHIFAQDLQADIFSGHVAGEAVINTRDFSYTAHIKAGDIDIAAMKTALSLEGMTALAGKVSADVGFSGKGLDLTALQIYGSLAAGPASYENLPIHALNASFYLADSDLIIDYASLDLPNHSSLGIEGSVNNLWSNPDLKLAFYGSHVDLALIREIIPRADMTGLADFKGTVAGSASNPQVELKFSGLKGNLFKQPFDSLQLTASGSLDGIGIDSFLMEKDGRETWRAAGSVGFTGERKVNLQLDTMGARMEDIAALIAPDQPITGNVDNIIKLTGSLDNPKAVGYIHFYQGSYHGVLLSGMDGDYFLDNGLLRLQDFHAYSPMIDMVLNGTIDSTQNLDMEIVASDIDLKRIEHKLPYEVSGHGTFNGKITGKLNSPEFHGVLDAVGIVMNGQNIDRLHGMVDYKNNIFTVDRFGFTQNDGSYDFSLSWNTDNQALCGNVVVQNADINAVAALLNQKNDALKGRLTSGVEITGTLDNPAAVIKGNIAKGSVAGYDVHDVKLDLQLLNHVIYLTELSGSQGEQGFFEASGVVPINGQIKAKLVANDIEAGMFTHLAGIETKVTGTAAIEAVFGGYTDNPAADLKITAKNGGIQGSTFDSFTGDMHLKNGLIKVNTLQAAKQVGEKNCRINVDGIVPLQAITADKNTKLNDYEQIQLNVALDQADLSLLPTLSQHIDWALGAMEGNIKIRGTVAHPLIDGSIVIPDGSMKIKELEKPITNMSSQVLFAGSKVTVKEFSGKMGDGDYNLSGFLEFEGLSPKHYDFSFTSNKLDIQSAFFRGPLNASLHVFDTDFYGRHWPKLIGQIDIEDALISVPSIPDSEGELPEVLLDMQVNVNNKVHAYSPYLYDLYLTGKVHAGGITSHPKMSGDLQVKRGGTINYLKTVFKVREGAAYFNQVDSFLPSIDFKADTKLSQAKVFLSAQGPLGAMDLKLSSTPEMSQTQIIQLLTLRDAYKNGQTNLNTGDLLAVGLQMSFLSEIEDVMRNFFYLDKFVLSRGDGSAFDHHTAETDDNKYDFNVEMGKYISDKVMMKYTRGLGATEINRYGLQYDMNDRFGMTLEREGGKYIVGLEARATF